MDTKTSFEIAGGSVPGRAHTLAGRNNQDAFSWAASDDGLVAVVCDGCGSAPHSEVGARIGARLFVQAATRLLGSSFGARDLLEQVSQDVLAGLRVLARQMSDAGGFVRTVRDHFLFTIVGLLVTARGATTFCLGDGLLVVNGFRTQLGPFPDNQPPYLGYRLLPDLPEIPEHAFVHSLSLNVFATMPVDAVQSVVLGTDGAIELDGQFWNDDRFFRNPDMVRRRLAVLNRGPQPGLSDDTTLVVVRRKAAEG
jgi:protein phosphatase 2C-like protein